MTFRPGWNLLALGASVLVSATAFYVPAAAWLLLPLLIAAASLAAYDAIWLRRHQADLVVTRDLPPIAGRDVPFDVSLRCVNRGQGRLRGSVRESPRPRRSALVAGPISGEGIVRSAEFRRPFAIATRGSFDFGPAWVRLVGPCGAARRDVGGVRSQPRQGVSRGTGRQGRSFAASFGRNPGA